MNTARTERMLRELHSEPTAQFFQSLFEFLGLGVSPASTQPGRDQRVQAGAESTSIA